jgi:hypothetical protein
MGPEDVGRQQGEKSMNIWVMTGSYEGEHFASTHFTEKGAKLAAIADMLEFLGVEDEETATTVINARAEYYRAPVSENDDKAEIHEWDQDKMRGMTQSELGVIFRDWAELAWDNDRGYVLEVIKTRIAA